MSSASDIEWFDPALVVYKITPLDDLSGIRGGDWDIRRRQEFASSVKPRSIAQRFIEGRRWEETDVFRGVYPRRFARGERVRGAATFDELVAQYYDRVDGLYEDMKANGFRLTRPEDDKPLPLPRFLIGRCGEVFIGNQGNHRLAIAQILKLDRIAATIRCRHKKAQ